MNPLLVAVALVAGSCLSIQAAVNSELGRHAGRPEWAALISFVVGVVGLGAWVGALRLPAPALASLARAPAWAWAGGVLGAIYVSAVVLLTPRLGVAATLGLAVAGQLGAALALDRFGLLGLSQRPLSASRLVGAALLVAGVVLIRR